MTMQSRLSSNVDPFVHEHVLMHKIWRYRHAYTHALPSLDENLDTAGHAVMLVRRLLTLDVTEGSYNIHNIIVCWRQQRLLPQYASHLARTRKSIHFFFFCLFLSLPHQVSLKWSKTQNRSLIQERFPSIFVKRNCKRLTYTHCFADGPVTYLTGQG